MVNQAEIVRVEKNSKLAEWLDWTKRISSLNGSTVKKSVLLVKCFNGENT